MSDDLTHNTLPEPEPETTGSAALREPVNLPVDLEAFVSSNLETYYTYACLRIGSSQPARKALDEALAEIGVHWDCLGRSENLNADTWQILRCAVDAYEARALRRSLNARMRESLNARMREMRASLGALDSPVGLYEAMLLLPERELDVLLLRREMGYDTQRTAWALGVHIATVGRSLNRAQERLELALQPRRVLRRTSPPEGT